MIQFAEVFPDKEIVVSLVRQLSWTHFIALIPLKDDLQRDFYAEMCRIERWSVRTLRKKINDMLYERTAISKKPEKMIEKDLAALRKEPDEEMPLGLILCAGKTSEQIELLQLDKSGITVAEYMTELPKREHTGTNIMDKTFKAKDIQIGIHPEGYRIDKTASPMDFYTKWQITPEGEWINPKPTCFDSMPQEGWHKEILK